MKILAIDTATEACSVALLYPSTKTEAQAFETDVIFDVCPQQHSQKILPMIDELLKRHQLNITELDGIAYGRGPGSFTGVRIAASTVQGLALGADLPVVEVSTLAIMAQQVYTQTGQTEVLSLIDARMQEVYLGQYEIVEGLAQEKSSEQVLAPDGALSVLKSMPETAGIAGTGFAAYADLFAPHLQNRQVEVEYPNAQFMLYLAKQALETGNSVKSDQIAPVYVRDKVTWKKLPHKA
jgi:tRNA threonylcarbamoyladenosine biosynthesis protein TsaB